MREADASIERCPAPGTSWSGTPSAAALARPLATGSTVSISRYHPPTNLRRRWEERVRRRALRRIAL